MKDGEVLEMVKRVAGERPAILMLWEFERALALYESRRKVQRLDTPDRFVGEIVVITRRHPKPPAHIAEFVENIFF